MCKLCERRDNTKKWIQKRAFERSKYYKKFYDFVKDQCEDNLEGLLIGMLFHSKNRRIAQIKKEIIDFICGGMSFLFSECHVYPS
jgi:hypothetical protein